MALIVYVFLFTTTLMHDLISCSFSHAIATREKSVCLLSTYLSTFWSTLSRVSDVSVSPAKSQ